MIPFLVKLANLLDTRGQHSIAREVDDLIEKLAQVDPGQHLITLYQDAERANVAAMEKWQEAQQAANERPSNSALLAARDEAKKQYDATWAARDQAKKEMDAYGPKPQAPQVETNVSNKAPAKKAPRKNLLVLQIQQSLGASPTGHWNPETNTKFINFMSADPARKNMMENGKFKGTLQQAAQQVSQPAEVAQAPAPEAPAAPVPFDSDIAGAPRRRV